MANLHFFLKESLFSTFHHYANQVKKAFQFLEAVANKIQSPNFNVNLTRLTNPGGNLQRTRGDPPHLDTTYQHVVKNQ